MSSTVSAPNRSPSPSFLLVDDHPTVRRGILSTLEREYPESVIEEASNLSGAVDTFDRRNPDIVIFDLELPDGDGWELLRRSNTTSPGGVAFSGTTRFICMSMHVDRRRVVKTLSLGADGFLSKEADSTELLRAVRAVRTGQSYLCLRVTTILVDWLRSTSDGEEAGVDERYRKLPPKERDILRLLAEGYTTAEIAGRLGIAKKTVANYRLKIMKSLDFENDRELRLFAEEEGLL